MVNIKLRKIRRSDLKYFLIWWKDKELIKLTSGIYEESDKILTEYFFNNLNTKKDRHFMILLNNKPIGHIALTHKNKSTFEMQIIIGERKNRGKGYGVSAIKKALDIGFHELGYNKAYIEVRPENKNALAVYKFCGFKELGLKKYPNNKFQPLVMKMQLRSEFFK